MRKHILAIGLLFGLGVCPGWAMEFRIQPDSDSAIVFARGAIVSGDTQQFRDAVRSQPGKDVVLFISSIGGSVLEAAELAEWVSRWRIPIYVYGRCVSACFLILAASPSRYVASTAVIGVHSAGSDGGETLGSMAATTAMAREAARYGVPQSIIGRMVTTQPDDVAWLSAAELKAMKVTVLDVSDPPSQKAAPAPPVLSQSAPPPPAASGGAAFSEGYAARIDWEQWFQRQTGSARAGAAFWAGQRSLPNPGSCVQVDSDFLAGCVQARQRLMPLDQRRKADPEFRRGWNAY